MPLSPAALELNVLTVKHFFRGAVTIGLFLVHSKTSCAGGERSQGRTTPISLPFPALRTRLDDSMCEEAAVGATPAVLWIY